MRVLWSILTFPFRLIGRLAALLGRFVAATVGFVLMVFGVALCAGAVLPLGIPLFVVGLILSLKALG